LIACAYSGTLEGHEHSQMISCIKLLGDGSHALSASGDRTIKLWDVEKQRAIISMAGHGREIFCCDTDRNDPSGESTLGRPLSFLGRPLSDRLLAIQVRAVI